MHWLMMLLCVGAGLFHLIKGEVQITTHRTVRGSVGRILGVLLFVGEGIRYVTPGEYAEHAGLIQVGLLFAVIIIGFVTSEKDRRTGKGGSGT